MKKKVVKKPKVDEVLAEEVVDDEPADNPEENSVVTEILSDIEQEEEEEQEEEHDIQLECVSIDGVERYQDPNGNLYDLKFNPLV